MSLDEIKVSDMMEINGYGYTDFSVVKSSIGMPTHSVEVKEGEFILNLHDGKKQFFRPIKLCLHTPSEHTFNGRSYDVELQLLHHYKGTDNQLGAVISIFFDLELGGISENDFLNSIFETLDLTSSSGVGTIRVLEFLQSVDFSSYWNYNGSLTVPPCKEDIKWTVIKEVQSISKEQLVRI